MMRFYRIISFILIVTLVTSITGCGRIDLSTSGLGSDLIDLSQAIPVINMGQLDFYSEQVFQDFHENPPKTYYERLWVCRDGRFFYTCTKIEKLIDGEWIECSQAELDKYNRSLTSGLKGRYVAFERGFKIKDPILFLENYNYSILHTNKKYLNRTALVVRVTSAQLDRPSYTVWLDKKTGFVLKYTEDTPLFDPIYKLEVTLFDTTPDFSSIDLLDSKPVDEPLSSDNSLANGFSFRTYKPRYLLDGFRQVSCVKRTLIHSDGNIDSFMLSYSDGLQTFSMFQSPTFIAPDTTKGGMQTLVQKVLDKENKARDAQTVFVTSATGLACVSKAGSLSWTFAAGGTTFIIRGKAHELELETFIHSLAPIEQ